MLRVCSGYTCLVPQNEAELSSEEAKEHSIMDSIIFVLYQHQHDGTFYLCLCLISFVCLRLVSQDVDEAELSLEEAKERKIMKLLLKVKNGTPPQRKAALRHLTDKARDLGAGPLFNQILPLLVRGVWLYAKRLFLRCMTVRMSFVVRGCCFSFYDRKH